MADFQKLPEPAARALVERYNDLLDREARLARARRELAESVEDAFGVAVVCDSRGRALLFRRRDEVGE